MVHDLTIMFLKGNRMNQPLCHLYFLTVMEHLSSDNQIGKFYDLIEWATQIKSKLDSEQTGEDIILLKLEFQAAVQVIIQQLALYFNPCDYQKQSDVSPVIQDINKLVCEQ